MNVTAQKAVVAGGGGGGGGRVIHERAAAMVAGSNIIPDTRKLMEPQAQTQALPQSPQVAAARAMSAAGSNPFTDVHALPQHQLTHVQVTLLIVYSLVFVFWITRIICSVFNIRAFNNFPGFGPVPQNGGGAKTANFSQQTGSSKKNIEEAALIDPSSSSSSSSSSLSSSVVMIDNDKNENFDKKFDNFRNEGDKSMYGNHANVSSLESRETTQGNIKDINGSDSAIITVGHNGITENLSERHFDSAEKQQQLIGLESKDKVGGVAAAGGSLRNSQAKGDSNNKTSSSEPIKSSASASSSGGGPPPPVTLDKFLNSFVLFGAIMIFFYFCDYWKMFPQGPREYSRDVFCFLVFLFFLVGSAFTIKDNQDKVLNRDQTEEWKGWMQVMFVWYHYFKAGEWYNWIRVYIACYVWMTGFGNFSFFWIRKDFSMWRMIKMLFRLNFLVAFVAMVTNNEYMLYYICAMHTYWFLTVYVFMRVLNSWNTDPYKMAAKFAAYAVCNAVIFDIPGFSEKIFRPVQFVLGYHDYNNKFDVMHEWSFRAGLDHWACFIGMLCAYNYPHFEAFMSYLDSKSVSQREQLKKLGVRTGLGVGALVVGTLWYQTLMTMDKYSYNAQHPYSSCIPILVFIVLRNIHPVVRSKHIGMFSWLGKITLETYLSQLHIYLLSNARMLLVYLPDYPLLNFAMASLVYLTLSHFLFNITNDASSFLIPRDPKRLVLHLAVMAALFGLASVLAYGIVV